MFIYDNGIKTLITFNNTYATYKNKLLFAKPNDNEIYGIALEKGYVISKCLDNTIKSGYEEVGKGGSGYQVFENILGSESEKYKSNKNINGSRYIYINKENLKNKIIKYMNFGGIITFGIFYNLGGAHEYSLHGYKLDKDGNLYIEIINPHNKGGYAKENIIFNKDKNKDKLISLENKKYPIINENDFVNDECKNSLISYESTGYLIMEYETFFKWYGTIDMCDPMIGSYEQIVEFIPNNKSMHIIEFEIKYKTKFKAYMFLKNKKSNVDNYNITLKYKNGNIIYSDKFDNYNKIIYEFLEKDRYVIEITINNSSNKRKINDVIYLKLQYFEEIESNINNNNNIINIGYKYIDIYKEIIFIQTFINQFNYGISFLITKLNSLKNQMKIVFILIIINTKYIIIFIKIIIIKIKIIIVFIYIIIILYLGFM